MIYFIATSTYNRGKKKKEVRNRWLESFFTRVVVSPNTKQAKRPNALIANTNSPSSAFFIGDTVLNVCQF